MSARPAYCDWMRVHVRAPFHLEATVRVLQRRPSNPVDVWSRGRYRRVLKTSDGLVLTEVTDCGTVDRPDVRFSVRPSASTTARADAAQVLRRMLGLDLNPQPMHALALRERKLRATAQALRGMRPPRYAGLFEAFANVIPFQQLSIDAGVAIVNRFVLRFGERFEHEGQTLYAFPTASAVAAARPATLRACGLSQSKAAVLREIARLIESGVLDEAAIAGLSSKEALRVLTELSGIGPWSAALILLRGFGRLDVFPPGDVGAMRGLRSLLELAPDAPLGPVEAHFDDLRGHLYFYALGASLLEKGLIQPAPGLTSKRRVRSMPLQRRSVEPASARASCAHAVVSTSEV